MDGGMYCDLSTGDKCRPARQPRQAASSMRLCLEAVKQNMVEEETQHLLWPPHEHASVCTLDIDTHSPQGWGSAIYHREKGGASEGISRDLELLVQSCEAIDVGVQATPSVH